MKAFGYHFLNNRIFIQEWQFIRALLLVTVPKPSRHPRRASNRAPAWRGAGKPNHDNRHRRGWISTAIGALPGRAYPSTLRHPSPAGASGHAANAAPHVAARSLPPARKTACPTPPWTPPIEFSSSRLKAR